MKYLISGGGTGGHIYPALAIAKEIKNKDKDAEILYVGTKAGLESELVPKEGFEFKTIRVTWLPRKINRQFFKAIWILFGGLKDANKIIKEFKPDVVVGTGGYVSGPVLLMAKKNRVATFVHEQNAFPGITNKILGRFVDKIGVTFEESIKYFKKKEKIVVTGNPIRSEILDIDKDSAYKNLEIDRDKPFILSFGGSGGQLQLNEAILGLIDNKLIEGYQIIHVTGDRLYDDFNKKLNIKNENLNKDIRIMPYLYDMPEALNIADLVICSAGAITLAEISALGIPSILVPKGYTAENHQEYNANAFKDAGASIVILEKDLDYKILNKTIEDILKDKNKLESMSENSKKLSDLSATTKIAKIVMELGI